jgi:hypothetical protein
MVEPALGGFHHVFKRTELNSTQQSIKETGLCRLQLSFQASIKKSGREPLTKQYLEDQKLSGMARDVTHLIRRNPIPSVPNSIGIGGFVARKMWK